ncbi:MAG TPA: hypothetical protein VJ600_08755 [Holophagaceae bacterium]|nr:hypothetical protein [Holophagaceae bacterium]
MKPANPVQDTGRGGGGSSPHADPRALALLLATRQSQAGLPRQAALAWERAAFAEAFGAEEPRRRVRAFLGGNTDLRG